MGEPTSSGEQEEFVKVKAIEIKPEPTASPEESGDRCQYGGGGIPRSWLDDFPWFEFVDGELGGVCHSCIETGHDGKLTNIEHYDLLSHMWSIDHQEAETIKEQKAATQQKDRLSGGIGGCKRRSSKTGAYDQMDGRGPPFESPEIRSQRYEQCQRVRRFCDHWLKIYKWLQYDAQHDLMFCKTCRKQNIGNNSFVQGSRCFKRESVRVHDMCKEHMLALNAESLATAVSNANKFVSPKPSLGKKATFLLQKLLKYFPWLLYNAETQVLICDTCQHHSVNTLYIDCTQEFDHKIIHQHIENKRHQSSMDAEFQGWQTMFDTANEEGNDLQLQEISGNAVHDLSGELFLKTETGVSPPPLSDPSVPLDSMDSANSELLTHCTTREDPTVSISHSPSKNNTSDRTDLDSNQPPITELTHLKAKLKLHARPLLKGIYKGKIQPTFGRFRSEWMREFSWLHYDKEHNVMQCLLCRKHKKKNGFVRGIRVFLRSFIMSHVKSVKHRKAADEEMLAAPDSELLAPPQVLLRRLDASHHQVSAHAIGHVSPRSIRTVKDEPNLEPLALGRTLGRCQEIIDSVLDVQDTMHSDATVIDNISRESTEYADLHNNLPYDDEGVTGGCVVLEKKKDGTLYKRIRKFRPIWLRDYPWLQYSLAEDLMRCMFCMKHHRSSAFTRGTRTFHLDNIKKHEGSSGHQRAVGLELM